METPTLTDADLAGKIGVDKSTVTRLMKSLEKVEFVKREKGSGQYSLTHKLFQVGNVYVKNTNLTHEGRPLLEKLSAAFNKNAQMGRESPNPVKTLLTSAIESFMFHNTFVCSAWWYIKTVSYLNYFTFFNHPFNAFI